MASRAEGFPVVLHVLTFDVREKTITFRFGVKRAARSFWLREGAGLTATAAPVGGVHCYAAAFDRVICFATTAYEGL